MKTVWMYAGQGSQRVGMGKELYEKFPVFASVIDRADSMVSFDLKKMMFEGPAEDLSRTAFTQPCLAAFAAGVTEVLRQQDLHPDFTAGLSLGEYSALYAADVLDLASLMDLTAFRGKAMDRAGSGLQTKMCAVLGLDADTVTEVCRQAEKDTGETVEVSNYNAVGQNVISGMAAAVEAAKKKAMEAGARKCMDLKVSSAFHTSLMRPAADALAEKLTAVELRPMKMPVVFNAVGETADQEQIPELLRLQVMSGVRMVQSIRWLREHGAKRVVEIGPGHVLSGFVHRTEPELETVVLDTAEDLETYLSGSAGRADRESLM